LRGDRVDERAYQRRAAPVERGALVLEQRRDEERMAVEFERTHVAGVVERGDAQRTAFDRGAERRSEAVTAVVAFFDARDTSAPSDPSRFSCSYDGAPTGGTVTCVGGVLDGTNNTLGGGVPQSRPSLPDSACLPTVSKSKRCNSH